MSYAIVIAPDAYSQWRALDPMIQELTLDELEAIAANPPIPPDDDVVRDFAYKTGGDTQVVFLRFSVDRGRHKVVLTGAVCVPRAS
jgi:mRNA-degrading endonuclease RelE of RelBE toxin-antitoxin system